MAGEHDHHEDARESESEAAPPVSEAGAVVNGRQERLLSEREHLYRALARAAGQIVWHTDAQGILHEGTAAWNAYTGQNLENDAACNLINAIHPEDRERVSQVWLHAIATKTPYDIEYRIQRHDGVYRLFAVRGVPVFEVGGSVREWIGIGTDITDSREAARKLRENEEHYRGLADAIPLILWIARPDGYIYYYNRRWFEYTGLDLEQTQGWGWQSVLHPADAQAAMERWSEAVRTVKPYMMAYRFRRVDNLYRWHLVRALPVLDARNKVTAWVGTCTDIDDQKRAEEEAGIRALQQAAVAEIGQYALQGMELEPLFDYVLSHVVQVLDVEYAAVTEQLPDGGMRGRLLSANGFEYHTMTHWSNFQISYTLAVRKPVIVHDFRSEVRFTVPDEIRAYQFASSVSMMINGHPEPFGVLIVYTTRRRDFTHDATYFLQAIANVLSAAIERKRAETELAQALAALQDTNAQLENANAQLEHVNKVQSDFISIVSHEFRTTLTSIQGFSELMRDEDFGYAEIKEYANDINTDAQRLSRMISELLDLNRMKSGRMKFHPEWLDLNALITKVTDRIALNAPKHSLRRQLDPQLPRISGDGDKLTQVMTNLLHNAVKYSPQGGEILVSSQRLAYAVQVSVQDHGVGIPTEALEQIFEPYSRISSKQTRYIEGTGMGLAIVQQIIQMHNGKVWAESVPGVGSTFHVILPLSDTQVQHD